MEIEKESERKRERKRRREREVGRGCSAYMHGGFTYIIMSATRLKAAQKERNAACNIAANVNLFRSHSRTQRVPEKRYHDNG
jgi:hypothetical protein